LNQRITSARFPYIPIRIAIAGNPNPGTIEVDAFVDTGFDGDVVLPESFILELGEPRTTARWRMADGSLVVTGSYAANVELVGLPGQHPVRVSLLGPQAFVGRALTDRFRLILDHGRQVIVEP
jgi:predicted aspartyl protease